MENKPISNLFLRIHRAYLFSFNVTTYSANKYQTDRSAEKVYSLLKQLWNVFCRRYVEADIIAVRRSGRESRAIER